MDDNSNTKGSRRSSGSADADDSGIDKLSFDEHRVPPRSSSEEDHDHHGAGGGGSGRSRRRRRGGSAHGGLLLRGDDVSLFNIVVEGVIERDRQRLRRRIIRYTSFAAAVVCCLCAGSIAAFSLYGPLLLSRLHYSQFQVNAVSVAAEVAQYLPVPLVGYLCDRYSRRLLCLAAAIFFGGGYLLAALTYRQGPYNDGGWSYGVMVVAFLGVGVGTCCMMMASVTTCAKSFATSRHKGMALAVPLAAFGLSGMWLTQVGSRLLYERGGPYGQTGDVDVYRFFLFLAGLLFSVGILGAMALQVVTEEDPIDEATVVAAAAAAATTDDELERGGLLEDASTPSSHQGVVRGGEEGGSTTAYGAISIPHSSQSSIIDRNPQNPHKFWFPWSDRLKKRMVLNRETRRFLTDGNMWLLASGFFLILGPAEAFIFNLGTILHSLYPASAQSSPTFNSPATNVSIVAISSTVARLVTGIISDSFAPQPCVALDVKPAAGRGGWGRPPPLPPPPTSSSSSPPPSPLPLLSSPRHPPLAPPPPRRRRHPPQVSRVVLLITSGLFLFTGQILLASSTVQHYPNLFPLVSALNGIGYGGVFSLTPIIIGVVWGVDNFGTNWGIVAATPAVAGTIWGAVYSVVYEHGVGDRRGGGGGGVGGLGGEGGVASGGGGGGGREDSRLCYGARCYVPTFAAMAACSFIALAAWTRAWHAWRKNGVVV